MVLFPVHDAGQGCLAELLERDVHADSAEADALGGGADAEHAHALAPNEALLPERLQRIVPAVVLGNHPQARRPAVHGIELVIVWKLLTHQLYISNCYSSPQIFLFSSLIRFLSGTNPVSRL